VNSVRAVNRLIAVVLSGVLLVAGVITAVEVVWASFGDDPAVLHWQTARQWLTEHTLAGAESRLICIGLILVGLLFLACAWRPAPRPMSLGGHGPGLRADVDRRSLQRAVRTVVEHEPAVASARVRLHRHTLRIDVTAREKSTAGLAERITPLATGYLEALEPAVPPRVKVRTHAGTRTPAETAAVGVDNHA
jgi:Family of unknown function (DUF6286)